MRLINTAKLTQRGCNLDEAANKIRLIALDVDGVLTDGSIGYTGNSGEEIKFFNVRDGSGITMLRRAGIIVGIISGRRSLANATRAAELKLDFLVEKCWKKGDGLQEVAAKFNLSLDECLFVGDDFIDAAALSMCGLGVAVGDAAPQILKVADLQTEANGGRGAVREVAEWLLQQQGKWQAALEHYHLPL